jgi:hypothetical protein
MLIGVAGALVGGACGTVLAGSLAAGVDLRSLLMAVSAALCVSLCYQAYAMCCGE